MKHSLKVGLSFGLTSGAITTVGLIVGLGAGTGSRLAIIGGILTIAVADAFSDALGIHVSEESKNNHTTREVWESTISTLISKFIFASTFIVPILLFPVQTAITASIIWGLFLISLFSYIIANGKKSFQVVAEHLLIAIIVIIITHYVGVFVKSTFG